MTDSKDTAPKRSRFTDEQIRKAILCRLAGESREAIALSYRAKSYADIIGQAPRPEGAQRIKPSKLTEEAKAEILTLMKFLHYPEIAKLYGVTVAMIDHFLRHIRPTGGWSKHPPPKNSKLSDAEKKNIVARWKKGEAMKAIAARYEVSSPTIFYVIKREVPEEARKERKRKKRGKLSEKQKQEAVQRRKNGDRLADIGKVYGVSAVVIHKITKDAAPPEGWPNPRNRK